MPLQLIFIGMPWNKNLMWVVWSFQGCREGGDILQARVVYMCIHPHSPEPPKIGLSISNDYTLFRICAFVQMYSSNTTSNWNFLSLAKMWSRWRLALYTSRSANLLIYKSLLRVWSLQDHIEVVTLHQSTIIVWDLWLRWIFKLLFLNPS
jgi:hypothetical protein